MKFFNKKVLKIILPTSSVLFPCFFVASCSSNTSSYDVSNNVSLYSNIWNLSLLFNEIENTVFDKTIIELEEKINSEIKDNKENDFLMKIYSFYILWNAFKNPLTSNGTTQPNLSNEIINFSTFLTNKVISDNENISNDDKKTFSKFKNYINTFDYKISLLNFQGETINNELTLKEILSSNQYVLNFKIEFWTSDEETNQKMLNNNRSIMFKDLLNKQQREKIKKISNEDIKDIATKQFNYQSTKLYYDVNQKKFSTIILPSNINQNLLFETPDSGYAQSDKERKLFVINWYSESQSSNDYETYLEILFNQYSNFDISITSNWRLFLEKEGFIKNVDNSYEMKNIKINLNVPFIFDNNKYEEE